MINETTIASHAYAVTSPVSGTVTDCHGNTIISVKAGEQSIFIAPGPIAVIPDDASIVPISSDTKLSVNIGGGGGSGGLNVEVVNVLPDVGEPGIIYFVPIAGETGDNTYEEWTWLTEKNGWESLGSATIDLSGYASLSSANTFTASQSITGDLSVDGSINFQGNDLTTLLGVIQTSAVSQANTATDVKLQNYAKLTGGNNFTGDQTITNGSLTVSSLVAEGDYNINSMPVSAGIPGILESNKVYDLGSITTSPNLSTIQFSDTSLFVQTCEIWITAAATSIIPIWPADSIWPEETNQTAPETSLVNATAYRFIVRREHDGKLIISLSYSYSI